MKSARDKAPETDREGTFNGFGSAPDTMIDHLYFRGSSNACASPPSRAFTARPISDHYPISMTFSL